MATNRKTARQQRLRGAQTREPQDINFAFTLPPAPPAPRTTRSAVTPSSSRAARVIPTRGRGPSSSKRSGSTRKRVEQKTPSDNWAEKRQRMEVTGGDETSARRPPQDTKTPEREIEDELSSINPVALRVDEEVTESPRNAPGSGRRQHLSSDPAERGTPTKLKTPRDATRRTRKSMRKVPSPELDAVDEIDELSPDQPRTRPREQEVDELSPEQPRTQRGKREIAEEIPGADLLRQQSRRRRSVFEEPDTIDAAKIPNDNTSKKRRRRSAREKPDEPEEARGIPGADATKKRRRGGGLEEPEGEEISTTDTAKKRRRPSAPEEPDTVEAEEIPDTDAAKQKSRRRRRSALEEEPEERTSKRREVAEEIPDVDEQEEAVEIPIADAAKKLVSQRRRRSGLEEAEPTRSKHRASGPPTKASPAKQRAPKTRKPTGAKRRGAVPVTAYRMTCHDSDSGDDILNRAIPFASRSGVNAVDVLAQACDEFSGSAVDALGRGLEGAGSSAERREYRTKLLAVEAFAAESRWKLMELTISLDAEYAMRKRVRAVVKEKGELRAKLMQLRAEREQIALKMDAARIRHEEEGKDNETLTSLSTTLHDVALAASLGRDTTSGGSLAKPSLPVVIDKVAAMASSKSRGGDC
ncbi:hypothetical protein GMDG_01252 [Pseudogymnoascus destructans 20631-21]|uniref:Inner kinetochore subunit AME1 domain-containing protein n=1 Tax=Pseudogymnoascus destructans (strain ATCC MYA-4855 / 20631-21) TaxID=658429 RepID=L8FUS9_PSED2|nr:hypothetical protein GMDG_01252 [Pseudogymnoascus destructans 20631-21]